MRSSKRKKSENKHLRKYVVEASTSAKEEFKDVLEAESCIENPAQRYWLTRVYYQSLDRIINHMQVRFSAVSQKLAVAVGNVLQLNHERSLEFIKLYADILSIGMEVLKAEMTVMRNCIGKPDGENISISNITSPVKIETFPNSYKLMQIALTLPISSSSCERSFSAMRRIKNWLRSSMGQNRFSCLALANIEDEAAKSLKADDILDAFIKSGNRKILL
nr:unnamed protein product [Callosobruchus chinensis]